ncbi:MAG: hypothetical protein IIA00_07705 [Proteobacteria bacterium]|nr:hypothetical protein [Pseudomonadota bacterium]
MRRSEIVKAHTEVAKALRQSGLSQAIREMQKAIQPGGKIDIVPDKVLGFFKDYLAYANKFGPTELKIAEVYSLSCLAQTSWWIPILGITSDPSPEGANNIWEANNKIKFFEDSLPDIITLLEPEDLSLARRKIEEDEEKNKNKKQDTLEVIVIEEKRDISSPARLIAILNSIQDIYKAASILEGSPNDDLAVIACDSGSDKVFYFLGLAKSMNRVKEIIVSMWDRVVFYQELQVDKRIEIVAKSLPILEEIKKKKRKLGPEQAKILERCIIEGISQFIESGATIPEIQSRTTYNPRQLLAPQPKLLVHQESTGAESPEQKSTTMKLAEDISLEEIREADKK